MNGTPNSHRHKHTKIKHKLVVQLVRIQKKRNDNPQLICMVTCFPLHLLFIIPLHSNTRCPIIIIIVVSSSPASIDSFHYFSVILSTFSHFGDISLSLFFLLVYCLPIVCLLLYSSNVN